MFSKSSMRCGIKLVKIAYKPFFSKSSMRCGMWGKWSRHNPDISKSSMRCGIEREATLKATDRLKRGYVSAFEATIFMIGEYIIEKWNVEDSEGKAAPINGENLEAVINNINEPMQFVEKLLNEFNECASEFSKVVNETKKKSSNATNGKSKK